MNPSILFQVVHPIPSNVKPRVFVGDQVDVKKKVLAVTLKLEEAAAKRARKIELKAEQLAAKKLEAEARAEKNAIIKQTRDARNARLLVEVAARKAARIEAGAARREKVRREKMSAASLRTKAKNFMSVPSAA